MSLEAFMRPEVWALITAGSIIGYIFGVLPGLDGVVGLALFAPLGLYMKSDLTFYFYAALLGAVTFAGSVPAILFNIPGEPLSFVTTLDGHPMSRQGRGMEALAISAVATAMGAFISVAVLILCLPLAQDIVMLFGPAEKFWLVVWAFVAIPFLSGKDWLKGLLSVTFGLALAFMGRSVVTGEFRYTLGVHYLSSGLGIIPFLAIGVFAVRVIFDLLSSPQQPISMGSVKLDMHQVWKGALYVFKKPISLLRSAFIGTVIGVIPGIGPVTATFFAYMTARSCSKNPQNFGKGEPEGVLAPEAANNAEQGGAAITTLLLGIPGNLDWAILLGIMIMYGITPGPELIKDHPNVVLGIIGGTVAGNLLSSIIGLFVGTQLARLTGIKPLYIIPIILVSCMVGSFMINNMIWDCAIAILGGLCGYFLEKLGYELLPFTLGFVMAPPVEVNFYQTLQIGLGSYGGFFDSVTSISLIVICIVSIVLGPRLRVPESKEEVAS
jgi:putative tricarboxylic transport membrane protein